MEKKSKGKGGKRRQQFPKGSQRKGYVQASPAICIVVHDALRQLPINDKIAKEILDAATEKAVKYGYVVNYARQ